MKVRKNYAQRWSRKAGAAQTDYAEGVADPRADWHDATVAAESAYTQGLQQSLGQKRWTKGVSAAGTEWWQARAKQVGGGRYVEGVGYGQQQYIEGVTPYLDKIQSLTLPPRGPKGAPQNIQRVAAIATALHNLKVGTAG
jgi:hypothetical protein